MLVVAEVALAVVLLVGSGLMMRTFQAMRRVDPGFTQPEQVLTLRVSIPESLVPDKEQAARTHEQIARRIEQVPGVRAVGLSTSITMDGHDSNDPIFVEDFPGPGGRMPPLRRFKWVGEGYFEAMGNRLLAGRRSPGPTSTPRRPSSWSPRILPGSTGRALTAAIGRRIRQNPKNPWRTIVGVVGDVRDNGLAKPAPPIIYWPMMMKEFWDEPLMVQRTMGYAIRTRTRGFSDLAQGNTAGGLVSERQPPGRSGTNAGSSCGRNRWPRRRSCS